MADGRILMAAVLCLTLVDVNVDIYVSVKFGRE